MMGASQYFFRTRRNRQNSARMDIFDIATSFVLQLKLTFNRIFAAVTFLFRNPICGCIGIVFLL